MAKRPETGVNTESGYPFDVQKESYLPETIDIQPADSIADTASAPPADQPSADNDISLNQKIWGENGTGFEGYMQQVEEEKNAQQNWYDAYTDAELAALMEEMGIDPALMYEWSQSETPRTKQEGHSGADEHFLSDGTYLLVQYCQEMYRETDDPEERAYWHSVAEKARARGGYSGGADGSMYIPLGLLESDSDSQEGYVPQTQETDTPYERMQALMAAWQSAALEQSNASVDYAVQQAIREYERQLQDAQPKFKEQVESVAKEERQALDNAALYAELRGDRGGIGQEQYGAILNAAAQNRLAVQQAQTKLATDTARQITDLRAQGEFEKADAALEITQEYLSQLVKLEQWAAEHQLSQKEFLAEMQRWEAEYALELQQLQLSQNRWEQEFDYEQYLDGLKNTLSGEETQELDAAEIYRMIYDAGLTDSDRAAIKAYLMTKGVDEDLASAFASAYVTSEYTRLRYGQPDSWGNGWSESEWAKIMEAAEFNLKNKKYNAFNDHNMEWILSEISREQWVELCRLMERYGYSLEGFDPQ